MSGEVDATAVFAEQRDLLFGVAYRILGQAADAEDVVQDTWLRWRDVDHARVDNVTGYLVRVATRLAVDRLRLARNHRESYVGSWLPEPILTGPDVAEEVARADSVAVGLLMVLETLSPLERAVFVLHEAFGFSHAEIAAMLDRGEPAVRQLARRARGHVQARRPRFDADRSTHREVTERFLAACASGDVDGLVRMLAPDVELTGDSGGVGKGPLRVIKGADKVGRFLVGIAGYPPPEPAVYLAEVNGRPGIVSTSRGEPFAVFALDVVEGRITAVWLFTNPEKLAALRNVGRRSAAPPERPFRR
ncbi:RNA polymerase sigma factor SigJ [Allosalinactinospora lopnorensis]|uniref:RNA polymerase sigma factor SigJ n=1 Tax=Allosalinactinospora lopnorensis TaxID=1352348 RepID=UPI000623E87B|nr:RNA polymerase sigma factor SigJ [Allosalinactinospora lopnorensis]